MDTCQNSPRTQREEQSIQLRAELKQWERDFAASHNGCKAGREDIKQHPEIASKYKTYDKLRHALSHPPNPSTTTLKPASPARPKKRLSSIREDSHPTSAFQTPSKRAKHAHPLHSNPVLPSTSSLFPPQPPPHPNPLHPTNIDPYDPPFSSLLSPSKARTALGPTPQKDGHLLGLFDSLPPSGSISKTDRTPSRRQVLLPTAANVQATPSKRAGGVQTSAAPGSAWKYPVLGAVATPSTRRIAPAQLTPATRDRSDSGVRKLRFDSTPAFLRRDSQRGTKVTADGVGSDDDGAGERIAFSPVAFRRLPHPLRARPRPVAGRGLSALLQGLREMEEEKLDEELEMLREVEGVGQPRVLAGDSQVAAVGGVEMPLGPDRAVESSEEDGGVNEGRTRDGRPLKAWKKKGQKRATRTVKMRPNVAKWKPEPVWKGGVEEGDYDGEEAVGHRGDGLVGRDAERNGEMLVQETQVAGLEIDSRAEVGDDDEYTAGIIEAETDEDNNGDDGEYEGDGAALPDATTTAEAGGQDMQSQMKAWRREKQELKQAKEEEKKEGGFVQKVKRKISATAHANFRALKIRGKGVQGKRKGGFGRKRL